MEQRKAGQGGERANHDVAALMAHQAGHADRLQFTLLQQLGIGLTHNQAQTGEQSYHVDSKSHAEREAPAPADKFFSGQACVQIGKQCGGNDEAQWRTELANHGIPAALVLGCGHGQQRRQAIPGTTQRQALTNAQHHQCPDSLHARSFKAGQKRHAHCAYAQQQQGQRQLGGATPAALHSHGQCRANRPGNKCQRKDGERRQCSIQLGHIGEQQRGEHQHAGDAEHKEVKVLG